MTGLSLEMLGLIVPAFFAGLVVAATHVPLGQEVLKRGIIFIDLAIAQIAALGVVVSGIVFHAEDGIIPMIIAMAFALTGSSLFAWLEHTAPKHQEAFIGCAFILSASLIILLLAGNPHGGEEMQGLLAGQILWVRWEQIAVTAIISAVVLFLWLRFPDKKSLLFYTVFPIVVTLSVQLVGVYLVFASLIIPALGAVRFKRKLLAGYSIAVLAITGGLTYSIISDLPAGPVLVCSYALAGLLILSGRRFF